jgi:hypothetical protein
VPELVAPPVPAPELSRGWIRAVLFEHGIDDWVDLGPDPVRRHWVGESYAEQFAAVYSAWKWLTDQGGADIDEPPEEKALPEALTLALGAADWTDFCVALLTVVRAEGLLLRGLARNGDDVARRAFDKAARDCAGQAALGYRELHRRSAFLDADGIQARLDRAVAATRSWLAEVAACGGEDVTAEWEARVAALVGPLGYRMP